MYDRAVSPEYPEPDRLRVVEAYRRRQLLEGCWKPMLAEHGTRQLGALRAKLVGEWDTSANLFRSVIEQTCTMYDEQPEQSGAKAVEELLEAGGWWTIARQHQQYVRGMHESLVYVGWDDEEGYPTFELVTPDVVTIDPAPTNAGRPQTIWRARQREVPGSPGERTWFWDRWSTAAGGSFSIWTNDRQREVTAAFVEQGMWSGASYPFRDGERPLLPFALYHDRGTGHGVWAPLHRDSEVVFGTLQVGLLWTANVHGVLRASWSQRLLFNGKVKGGTTEQAAGYAIRTVTPDPTAILQVDGDNAREGEWGSPLDIDAGERFARMYHARLSVEFGIPPSDLVIESLNPASGASIVVSQAGKRQIAKRDQVTFARGDRQLAAVVAAVARANKVECSAEGFRLRYRGIALTIDERARLVPVVAQELELGLLDRVAAYQEIHPGTTPEEARADLDAQDKRRMAEEDREATDPTAVGTTGEPTKVQDTALNGAQVDSAKSIVVDVAAGQLPRDSGVAMLEVFFQLAGADANRVMGSVGNGFEPTPKAEPPSQPGPPLQDHDEDEDAPEVS